MMVGRDGRQSNGRRRVKIWFGLAAGVLIVMALAIVVVAWIKGGIQPAQMTEIPAPIGSGQADGA
jgi:NADH:ubiquinone oxidoreductase subunit 6 (subunit J)